MSGGKRQSDYDLFCKTDKTIKKYTLKDIYKYTPYQISSDSSLNISRWKKFVSKNNILEK